MKFLLSALLFPMLLTANSLEPTLDEEREWLKEETFVVSASRVKENIKKTAATVNVIDAEMIEAMGANTLLDVLRTVPGLGIHQSQLFMHAIESRGIKTQFSEKVLIMLDGHSLNGLRNGGATFLYDTLNLENVQRIEIIRGPASALYGENALIALINVITKKSDEINGTIASVKVGSYNTQTYNLLFGKTINDISITANLNHVISDGYSAFIARDIRGKSGYTNASTEKTSLNFNVDTKGFYLMGQYVDRKEGGRFGEAKALSQRTSFNFETYFLEAGYKKKISDILSVHTRLYYGENTPNSTIEVFPKGPSAPANGNGILRDIPQILEKEKGVELLLTYRQNQITLVSGIMYEIQEVDSTAVKPSNQTEKLPQIAPTIDAVERDLYAFYTELLYDINEDIRLTVGGRYDYYSDFGGNFHPRFGATWQANETSTFKFMYGEAFRAPTFAELYNKNSPLFTGNKDLVPEMIRTVEVSYFNGDIDNTDITLTYFHNDLTDIIRLDSKGKYQNSGAVQTLGLETEVKYNLGRGSYILANYTYQDPTNKTFNRKMEGISRHKAYAAVNYRINKTYNLYVDANYKGEQFRAPGDIRERVESSIIANTTLLVKDIFVDDFKLRFSVYNMFDEKAYDSATFSPFDYRLPERSFMAELTYTF